MYSLSIEKQSESLKLNARSQLAKSEALRQSILKQAFSGKLVPQDPNDESAAELLKRIAKEKEALKPTSAPKKRTRKRSNEVATS